MRKFLYILILSIAIILGGTKAYIDYKIKEHIVKSFKKSEINYTKITISLFGNVKIFNLYSNLYKNITVDNITIFNIYKFYNPKTLPKNLNLKINKLNVEIDAVNLDLEKKYSLNKTELLKLGYQNLVINSNIKINFFPQKRRLKSSLKIQNSHADMNLNVSLDNFPNSLENLFLIEKSIIKQVNINYKDKGLFKNTLKYLAKRNNTNFLALKLNLLNKIKNNAKYINMKINIIDDTLENLVANIKIVE
jgi:hypothetical protein